MKPYDGQSVNHDDDFDHISEEMGYASQLMQLMNWIGRIPTTKQ